jgi:hypothetical protein
LRPSRKLESTEQFVGAKADGVAAICQKYGYAPNCDLCELAGWYGDGQCDRKLVEERVCLRADPDCYAADAGIPDTYAPYADAGVVCGDGECEGYEDAQNCPADCQPRNDGGSGYPDAGYPRPDSGSPWYRDAGYSRVDSGWYPRVDSGYPSQDSGWYPRVDTGWYPRYDSGYDSGWYPRVDSGWYPRDYGNPKLDAGYPRVDAYRWP